jgi:DNA-binding transcriptional LysR family regulator
MTMTFDVSVGNGPGISLNRKGVASGNGLGPDFHQALVGAPSYFARRPRPGTPHDLTDHACINLRLPTSGSFWSWPFVKDGRELKVRVEGPLAFNAIPLILNTALAGLGLAYLPEDVVQDDVAAGRLVRVLAEWSPVVTGYHLYYPIRTGDQARPSRCWLRRYAIGPNARLNFASPAAQEAVSRPSQIRDLNDELRLDPMNTGENLRALNCLLTHPQRQDGKRGSDWRSGR